MEKYSTRQPRETSQKTYVIFLDEEEMAEYRIRRKDIEELASKAGISFEDAIELLGKIRQTERVSSTMEKGSWISSKDKINTLSQILKFIPVESTLTLLSDMKFYELKELLESDNPFSIIKNI